MEKNKFSEFLLDDKNATHLSSYTISTLRQICKLEVIWGKSGVLYFDSPYFTYLLTKPAAKVSSN